MRELKFRAWVDWDEDNPIMEYFDLFNRVRQYCDKDVKVMQYTGLADKNGKEIYEGDRAIVHFSNATGIGVVEFYNGGFYLIPLSKYVEGCIEVYDTIKYIEIMGNIYEN